MTGILIAGITVLAVRIVYLEFTNRDLQYEIEQYRGLVMQWRNYLSDKKYGKDFQLWKRELDEQD
jgi:hypothetical protein